jgi:hypothetical protein
VIALIVTLVVLHANIMTSGSNESVCIVLIIGLAMTKNLVVLAIKMDGNLSLA